MSKRLYKYDVGDEVVGNELCRKGLPSKPGKKGTVYRQLDDSVQYDYEVIYDNDHRYRYKFKEEELDYPAPYKEEIS